MASKPVRLRQLAADDLEGSVSYLVAEASPDVAVRFVNAVEAALGHVGGHPHNGTLQFSYELDIPNLRAWPVAGFPYLVFYVENDDEIDVWRVLHTGRDLFSELTDGGAGG